MKAITQYLQRRGWACVDESWYTAVALWQRWYQGKVPAFHSYRQYNGKRKVCRTRKTLGMAKTIPEDWANLALNEKVEIVVSKASAHRRIQAVLKSNNFRVRANQLLELSFALGTGAFVEYLEGERVRIDYIRAGMIYPLSWYNGEILECAFGSERAVGREKQVTLTIHRRDGGGRYIIENHLFRRQGNALTETGLPEGTEPEVRTGSTVPLFQIIRPNTVNNIDLECPMGISVFANAIDQLEGVDLVYDSYQNEFRLGKKRITVPLTMARMVMEESGSVTPVFDDNDTEFYAVPALEGGEDKIVEHNMELRHEAHEAALKSGLALLSYKCGMGDDRYSFDQGQVRTAKEVVSDKSDLFQNLKKHELLLEHALVGLVEAVAVLLGIKPDFETAVHFDDSIIEDADSARQRDLQEVRDGIMQKWEFRAKWYGEDEETAKAMCAPEPDPLRAGLMLPPEYLSGLPDALVGLYGTVEADILANMAERIARYDYYIPAVQHQHQKLRAMGALESEIEERLAALTGRSVRGLRELMQEAVKKSLTADAALYAAAGMGEVDVLAAAGVKEVLRAGLEQTGGLFASLPGTVAHTASRQFETALDRAWLQVASGAFDYNSAIRFAVKDLSRQGVGAVTSPSGHVDTLEAAVRRAVVTGCNQTAARSQLALMDDLGVDLVETTAHAGARPSHQKWQGQIFSRSGRSEKYPDFASSTGYGTGAGLCGWNCSHSFAPYIEGAPRAYSPALLKEYAAESVTYKGRKMTEYEAGQTQRYMERQIRRWKREYKAMEAAGQPTDEAAAKISQWRQREKAFCRQTGRQGERSQIAKALAKSAKGGIIKATDDDSFIIGKSLGAKAKNYEIIDKRTGMIYRFVEGTRIKNPTVFAGYNGVKPLKEETIAGLVSEFGGTPDKWQHAKGVGVLDVDGEEIMAEVHWFQEETVGKVKFKVKEWLDD